MDVFLQVFGAVALAQTAVGFAYAMENTEAFTNFEKVFFLLHSSMEVAAEALFLLMTLTTLYAEERCCNCMIDGGEDLMEGIKSWTRDALHNAVSRDAVMGVNDFSAPAFFALLLSLLSVVLWATFYPVWGFSSEGESEDVRLALSIASAACVAIVLLMPLFCIRNDRLDRYVNNSIYFAFGVEKVFVLYFLLADVERLCAGPLGRTFVALLLLEIFSICVILVRVCTGYR
ncbi:unnamed protein product [Ascophyllum nodosum]